MAQEQYENLPGVKVTYQDGNLYSGNQKLNASTQSMLIIGSAVDGPVGVPISVKQIGVKTADKLFGGLIDRKTKQPLPTSLVRGMYEAIKAGNEDIRLLRLDGRSARTELAAKDLARSTEQFLDYASGNKAFSAPVNVPSDGVFVEITSISEKDASGKTVVLNPTSVIDYIDKTPGAEQIYFYSNKMRPGNTVVFDFDYETRTYTFVPKKDNSGNPDYSDPDYTLTRDATNKHYFYSSRSNWSQKLESGHIPVVTVKSASGAVYTIPSMNAAGEYIYRVGKGDTANPLLDPWSSKDYKNGGIFFTSAYDAEVAKGTYPDITATGVKVMVEYAWYTALANHGESTAKIPGTAVTYDLNYTPMTDGFSLFYVVDGVKTELKEGTDYSLSLVEKKVTVNAGVAPVGAPLYANYKTTSSTTSDPVLVVEGKYPGSVYGTLTDFYDTSTITGVAVKVEIDREDPTGENKVITFFKPESKRLTYKDDALVYRTKDLTRVTTLREFVNYVNNDPMNNIVTLSCDNIYGPVLLKGLLPTDTVYLGQVSPGVLKEDPTQPANTPARYPWLGDDGIYDVTNEKDMKRVYEILGGKYDTDLQGNSVLVQQGIYQKLENYVVDAIVLLDVYANTKIESDEGSVESKNFATQLAQHCAVVTAKTWETIGFIGVAPVPNADLVSVQNYIDELTAPGMNEHYMYNEATHEYILDDDGERIDIGRYVNVVFGPEVGLTNEKLGNYVSSGVVVYAALTTTLNPEVATTNKSMDSVYGLRYLLSEAQHNQLVGGRYVTFDQKTNNNGVSRYVVKDGVTAALPTSDYTRLSTVRITHAAVQLVRQTADPFIGQPNGLAQRNALAAEIQAGLDRLKELGVLQRFTFTIYSSVQDKVIGNAFITLELVPQFETRKFLTSVVLKAS